MWSQRKYLNFLKTIHQLQVWENMREAIKLNLFIVLALAGLLLFTSCGQGTPAGPSPTPDPCSEDNLPLEVEKVNELMRAFDDAAILAAKTPRDELNIPVSELQRIRRNAEDQKVPVCLDTLKKKQVAYMNTVIQTLIALVGGADQETVNQGAVLSRQQRNEYIAELARVLGVTIAPVPSPAPFLP